VQRLSKFWKDEYDWRKTEAELNKLPNFTTPIEVDGYGAINVHFVHKTCTVPDVKAIPLCFIHGWPGSFIEVVKLLPLLTEGSEGPYFEYVIGPLSYFGESV